MAPKLVKTDGIEVEGRSYELRFYERRTLRGGRRYSCEVVLGETDRIIIDDDSLAGLEQRVRHLVPATIYSRSRNTDYTVYTDLTARPGTLGPSGQGRPAGTGAARGGRGESHGRTDHPEPEFES